MQRRHFLKLTASSSLVLTLPGAAGLFQDETRRHLLAHPDLLTLLGDEQVHDIGRAYRDQRPLENDPETLVAILTAGGDGLRGCTGSTLQTALDRRIRTEFATGQTVQVNGWVLAVTEARQSALYSLLYA